MVILRSPLFSPGLYSTSLLLKDRTYIDGLFCSFFFVFIIHGVDASIHAYLSHFHGLSAYRIFQKSQQIFLLPFVLIKFYFYSMHIYIYIYLVEECIYLVATPELERLDGMMSRGFSFWIWRILERKEICIYLIHPFLSFFFNSRFETRT